MRRSLLTIPLTPEIYYIYIHTVTDELHLIGSMVIASAKTLLQYIICVSIFSRDDPTWEIVADWIIILIINQSYHTGDWYIILSWTNNAQSGHNSDVL